MEKIQQLLDQNENIIWEKSKKKDQSFTSFKKLLLLSSPYAISYIIAISLFYVLDYITFMEILYTFLLILSIILVSFYYSFRMEKKIMKKYNLNHNELKSYYKFWILTKDKWIQKNLDINTEITFEDLPPNTLEQVKDIVVVNLSAIKAVMVGIEEYDLHRVWLYVDDSFTEYKDSNLGIELESGEEYKQFMDVLRKYVPLDEPEQEDLGYGVKYIYYLHEGIIENEGN